VFSRKRMRTLNDAQNVRRETIVSPTTRETPLTASAVLSERLKTNVYVKLELFQKTGSFKVRGAFNKALGLKAEERGQGLVAVSGGNHAQAVAYVARTLGLKSVVLMPDSTPANYVDATRGYGAEIKFAANVGTAFAEVAQYEREGWAYVHPFDDPVVMAGQGTIGLEILDDVPQVTDIIVSIGGGGLIGGIATAVRSLKPSVRLWGVETEGADCMSKSLAAGKIGCTRYRAEEFHQRAPFFGISQGFGGRVQVESLAVYGRILKIHRVAAESLQRVLRVRFPNGHRVHVASLECGRHVGTFHIHETDIRFEQHS